tara:strand:+ start:9344 stop:10045 length:702 start_codon:yes stop_codon:yes gene_type:complete
MKNDKKNTEYEHFSTLAREWWSKNGKFKLLHDIQPLRTEYILKSLNKKKLNNLKILDLGCGGGLISEKLYELGAEVTGIDFVEENINVANQHAKKNRYKIKYTVKDFEKEKIKSKFDVIIIFEVLEHLNDWEKFLKKIKINLKKNGILIISTINRNLISKFFSIDLAENLLNWIPLNTHSYYKFIKPEELEYILSKNNFKNIQFKGITYNLIKTSWQFSENTSINYFCSCKLS